MADHEIDAAEEPTDEDEAPEEDSVVLELARELEAEREERVIHIPDLEAEREPEREELEADREERVVHIPDVPESFCESEGMDEDSQFMEFLTAVHERLETLRVLNESETLTKNELFSMPLTVQTLAHKKKKNALEAKLKEIEDAVKIFNRPKVFISMD